MTTISWHSGEDIHYENATSEESHQLKLKYSLTGLLEIGVNFFGSTIMKASVISYTGKNMNLFSIYFLNIFSQLKVCSVEFHLIQLTKLSSFRAGTVLYVVKTTH